MKPEGPIARRGDYRVEKIPFAIGAAFIRARHYARGCANTAVYMHGLIRRETGALVGAAQWLPPTKVCALSVHRDWKRVLALSRLVLLDNEPRNAESLLIGASVRDIRRGGRWAALVTFADESQGHSGTIYQATNWEYLGRTRPEPRWIDGEGRQVARKATHSRTAAEMRALGYRCVGKFSKHKFRLILEP